MKVFRATGWRRFIIGLYRYILIATNWKGRLEMSKDGWIIIWAMAMAFFFTNIYFLDKKNKRIQYLETQCQCSQSENDSTQGGTE